MWSMHIICWTPIPYPTEVPQSLLSQSLLSQSLLSKECSATGLHILLHSWHCTAKCYAAASYVAATQLLLAVRDGTTVINHH